MIYGAIAFVVYKLVTSAAAKNASAPANKAPVKAKAPHEVLGVKPDANEAEVKRAYQRLVQQYHPDRVANAAPELQALAEQRTKDLNAAYREMMDALR